MWQHELPILNAGQPPKATYPHLRAHNTSFITRYSQKKGTLITLGLALLAIFAAAIAIPIIITRERNNHHSSSGGHETNTAATSGGNGSVITLDDGSTFVYLNDFGGDWAFDPHNPFGPGGKAQNWSKRIGSDDWVWGTDTARGVNLG